MDSISDTMVFELTDDDKEFLLGLARKSITHYMKSGEIPTLPPDELPDEKLLEDRACFVTLHQSENLRGCIGSLEARRPLFIDCIENAIASAFHDPRFAPLSEGELKSVKISISVLTKPEPFEVSDPDELLEKLVPGNDGLILQNGIRSATFLPSVWEQLPDKKEFLSRLSMKAGLLPDAWQDSETTFQKYHTIEFSE
jgi:hypothetical protein